MIWELRNQLKTLECKLTEKHRGSTNEMCNSVQSDQNKQLRERVHN